MWCASDPPVSVSAVIMSVSARTYMHVDGRRTCVCTYAPTLTLKHNTRTHAQDAQSVEEARASPTEDLIGSTESVNLLISQDRDASPHESELPPERKQVCVCVCVCARARACAHTHARLCVYHAYALVTKWTRTRTRTHAHAHTPPLSIAAELENGSAPTRGKSTGCVSAAR